MNEFFTGYHQPSDAYRIESAFISVNRLLTRISDFAIGRWVMDSGAFTALMKHGEHALTVQQYAAQIKRWKRCGDLLAAVTQDYMCEAPMLKRTGMTIPQHQQKTIDRYDALVACDTGVYIMPVLQGFSPGDYVSHVRQYGARLGWGAWVGVGSVCKRNGDPRQILAVLLAIKQERPDLRLHGFGLKLTALKNVFIQSLLHTADSMAWSFANRRRGKDANNHRGALDFKLQIEALLGDQIGSTERELQRQLISSPGKIIRCTALSHIPSATL